MIFSERFLSAKMFPPPAGCSERTKYHRPGRRHYSFKRGGAITVYRAMERKGPGPGVSFAKGCAHAHGSDSNRREPVLLHLDLSSYHDGRLVPQHCAKGVSAYLRILCKCIPYNIGAGPAIRKVYQMADGARQRAGGFLLGPLSFRPRTANRAPEAEKNKGKKQAGTRYIFIL